MEWIGYNTKTRTSFPYHLRDAVAAAATPQKKRSQKPYGHTWTANPIAAFDLTARGKDRPAIEVPRESPGEKDSEYPAMGNPMPLPLWKRLIIDGPFKEVIRKQLIRNAFSPDQRLHPRTHATDDFRFHVWMCKALGKTRGQRFLDVRRAFTTALNCEKVDTDVPDDRFLANYWRTERMRAYSSPPYTDWMAVIQNNSDVRDLVLQVWNAMPKSSAELVKRTYIHFSVLLECALFCGRASTRKGSEKYRLLLTARDRQAVEALVEVDWKTDSGGHKRMDEPHFTEYLMSTLHMWAETWDPEEYTDLLRMLSPFLFDTTGSLRAIERKEDVQVETVLGLAAKQLEKHEPEKVMTLSEKRFMNDKLVAMGTAVPSPGERPYNGLGPYIPRRDQVTQSDESDVPAAKVNHKANMPPTVTYEYLDKIINTLETSSFAGGRNGFLEAAQESKVVASLVSPHSRIVPLNQFNRHVYGKQAKVEDFTLEKVVMERMTHRLNTGHSIDDSTAFLSYLHDQTIESHHLHRMNATRPRVFDNFMQALDTLKVTNTASPTTATNLLSPAAEGVIDHMLRPATAPPVAAPLATSSPPRGSGGVSSPKKSQLPRRTNADLRKRVLAAQQYRRRSPPKRPSSAPPAVADDIMELKKIQSQYPTRPTQASL